MIKKVSTMEEITITLFTMSSAIMAGLTFGIPKYGPMMAFVVMALLMIYWQLHNIKLLNRDKLAKEVTAEMLVEKEALVNRMGDQLIKQLADELDKIIKNNKVDPVEEFKKRYKEIIKNFDATD